MKGIGWLAIAPLNWTCRGRTELSAKLLQIVDLKTRFVSEMGTVRAVDGASFTLESGQALGIVVENRFGKSIMSHSLLRLSA